MSILVLTSDTLIGTPATGNLEYNGQFFGTDSNASRAQMQRITQATVVTLTNQTAPDFTGIPSWAKRITINVRGLSTNGTAPPLIQLGTGATPTYATSGYLGSNTLLVSASGVAVANFTTAFGIGLNTSNWTAATVINGSVTISLLDATNNVWCANGTFGASNTTWMYFTAGSVALSAALTAVRLYIDGTQQFDAGSINILYEG